MQSVTGSVAAGLTLPGRRLDEVGAGGDRDQRRAADVVVRAELARLEDDLEVRVAARLLHADDLVEHLRVAAREERAAVDDHVDLVGADSTTARVSATLISVGDCPDGNAVATDATLTPLPATRSFAVATRLG